ncbi:hypothetical protein K7432_016366, partial [Basidiobolus ranarum]
GNTLNKCIIYLLIRSFKPFPTSEIHQVEILTHTKKGKGKAYEYSESSNEQLNHIQCATNKLPTNIKISTEHNTPVVSPEDDSSDEYMPLPLSMKRPRKARDRSLKTTIQNNDATKISNRSEVTNRKLMPKSSSIGYYSLPGEIQEDENLELFDEDISEVDEDRIPCRTLDNFVIYDVANSNQLVTIERIDDEGRELRASGIVRAIMVSGGDPDIDENVDTEEQDNEDFEIDENGDLNQVDEFPILSVKLSTIFFWEVQLVDDGMSAIWLRTQYAWYKLVRPTEDYEKYYLPVFKRIRLANMLITKMVSQTETTYEQFIATMNQHQSSSLTSENIRVNFCETDITKNIDYICEEISVYLEDQEDYSILNSPLFHRLVEIRNKDENGRKYREPQLVDVRDSATRKTIRKIKKSKLAENPACVTPHIRNLTVGLFTRHIVMPKHLNTTMTAMEEIKPLGDSEPSIEIENTIYKTVSQRKKYKLSEGREVKWLGESIGTLRSKTYYSCAGIGEIELTIGDCVQLNSDFTEPNYARIQYMYQDTLGINYFHGRTLFHGRQTIMEEVSHPFELFLVDQCNTWNMSSIIARCRLTLLGLDEPEPQQRPEPDLYFYRFWYDPSSLTFEDVYNHELNPGKRTKLKNCFSCEHEHQESEKQYPRSLNEKHISGFKYKGYEYHLSDYVYLIPSAPSGPYDIGQIVELICSSGDMRDLRRVRVRCLVRCDTLLSKYKEKTPQTRFERKDTRELFITEQYLTLSIDRLEGTCWVQHKDTIADLDSYKDQADTFYISGQREFKQGTGPLEDVPVSSIENCALCKSAREKAHDKFKKLQKSRGPLTALDIFSGCGGLTCGLKQSGIVETKYAIEFYSSAALSFEKNFPQAKVYNQCANLLLDRAIAIHHRGETFPPVKDHMNRIMPEMPAPDTIDFVYCGPPCQGFSGINRFKKADDVKNSLIATSLSYVDFYKPEYFLLENVRGLLAYLG